MASYEFLCTLIWALCNCSSRTHGYLFKEINFIASWTEEIIEMSVKWNDVAKIERMRLLKQEMLRTIKVTNMLMKINIFWKKEELISDKKNWTNVKRHFFVLLEFLRFY